MTKLIDRLVEMFLNRFLPIKRKAIPTKDEIADLIDRRLQGSENGEDGKFITIKRKGYYYRITRSVDEHY